MCKTPVALILHFISFNFMLKERETRFPRLPKVKSHKPKPDVKRHTTKHVVFDEVKMFLTTSHRRHHLGGCCRSWRGEEPLGKNT